MLVLRSTFLASTLMFQAGSNCQQQVEQSVVLCSALLRVLQKAPHTLPSDGLRWWCMRALCRPALASGY